MTKAALLLTFTSSGGCGGVKLEVPEQTVDANEAVDIYLWGTDQALLDGYLLFAGASSLGQGELRQMPGQTEVQYFELAGGGELFQFDWPLSRITSITAYGGILAVDEAGTVSVVAARGADMSGWLARSGLSCLRPVVGAPKMFGTIRVETERAPWCRVWRWTAPAKAEDAPHRDCTDATADDDEAAAGFWFFLRRDGLTVQEFSLALTVWEEPEFGDMDGWEIIENQFGLKRLTIDGGTVTYRDDREKSTMITLWTSSLEADTCSELGID